VKVEQCKTHSTLVLPLADQTVSILRQYLQHGDLDSRRPQLFLRARCPCDCASWLCRSAAARSDALAQSKDLCVAQ
jgi:hypothetical protein